MTFHRDAGNIAKILFSLVFEIVFFPFKIPEISLIINIVSGFSD